MYNPAETGLYYLNSRYYSPEFGRFINADGIIDNRGLITQNLFAYCGNNPVNCNDNDGNIAAWAVTGLVGGLIGAPVAMVAAVGVDSAFGNPKIFKVASDALGYGISNFYVGGNVSLLQTIIELF